MSKFKNYDAEDKNLKMADSRKMKSEEGIGGTDLSGIKRAKGISTMAPLAAKKHNKAPIVVDIIVGTAMILLVVALLVVAYLAFTYYSNDYNGVDIRYTLMCEDEDLASVVSLNNSDVFVDVDGNTLYFGKVKEIKQENSDGKSAIILEIKISDVKFREGEGYTVSSERLAVGKKFTFRYGTKYISGIVVEIENLSKGGK
jgi:hypothetical protein